MPCRGSGTPGVVTVWDQLCSVWNVEIDKNSANQAAYATALVMMVESLGPSPLPNLKAQIFYVMWGSFFLYRAFITMTLRRDPPSVSVITLGLSVSRVLSYSLATVLCCWDVQGMLLTPVDQDGAAGSPVVVARVAVIVVFYVTLQVNYHCQKLLTAWNVQGRKTPISAFLFKYVSAPHYLCDFIALWCIAFAAPTLITYFVVGAWSSLLFLFAHNDVHTYNMRTYGKARMQGRVAMFPFCV